ncbi:MAG: hypothetical protein WCO56_05750 [Verrucomicrobiota bacterium]
MRCGILSWVVLGWLMLAGSAQADSAMVIKVLPHFLDLKGRQSLSPSLYARDAYQAKLRREHDQRSALRFDVQWKASGYTNLKLRVELRGMKEKLPTLRTLEAPVTKQSWLSTWTQLTLGGDDYKAFGELAAWRATLWNGDQMVGEQTSFLW